MSGVYISQVIGYRFTDRRFVFDTVAEVQIEAVSLLGPILYYEHRNYMMMKVCVFDSDRFHRHRIYKIIYDRRRCSRCKSPDLLSSNLRSPAILTEILHDFPQENAGRVSGFGHNRFLPSQLQFIYHFAARRYVVSML
jgi:hypothetical protein